MPLGAPIALLPYMFQLRLRMTAQPRRAVEAVKALRCIAVEAQVERGFLASRIIRKSVILRRFVSRKTGPANLN